jgi:hypothetical protein
MHKVFVTTQPSSRTMPTSLCSRLNPPMYYPGVLGFVRHPGVLEAGVQ